MDQIIKVYHKSVSCFENRRADRLEVLYANRGQGLRGCCCHCFVRVHRRRCGDGVFVDVERANEGIWAHALSMVCTNFLWIYLDLDICVYIYLLSHPYTHARALRGHPGTRPPTPPHPPHTPEDTYLLLPRGKSFSTRHHNTV